MTGSGSVINHTNYFSNIYKILISSLINKSLKCVHFKNEKLTRCSSHTHTHTQS